MPDQRGLLLTTAMRLQARLAINYQKFVDDRQRRDVYRLLFLYLQV